MSLTHVLLVEVVKYARETGLESPPLEPGTSGSTKQMQVPLHLHYNLVDPDRKLWNTFIDYVLEWKPILKKVYADPC